MSETTQFVVGGRVRLTGTYLGVGIGTVVTIYTAGAKVRVRWDDGVVTIIPSNMLMRWVDRAAQTTTAGA